MNRPQALVVGATGGIGGVLAERLLAAGWRVRALHRDPERVRHTQPGLEWVRGDAMSEADVVAAAAGAQVVVHAVNPPGYRNWAGLQMPMLNASIAAARASGARLLFPASVYNYGDDAFPHLREDSPQTPFTRKGAIRVRMEQALKDSGVPLLILRMGDFFGPAPGNNWFSHGMIRQGRPISSVTYAGPLEIPHAWAYLPDAAETFVRLLETDLEPQAVFHFRGHEMTGHELVAGLEAAAGRRLPVRQLPWLAIAAAAPFAETMREMQEMRYLWRKAVLLDNAHLVDRLGEEPHTPLVGALTAVLAGHGALPDRMRAAA